MEEKFADTKTEVQSRMDEFKKIMESLQANVVILKKVVLQGCPSLNADVGIKMGTVMQRNSKISHGTWSNSSMLLVYQRQRKSSSLACISRVMRNFGGALE